MEMYKLDDQMKIIFARMKIHNYIRKHAEHA